VRTTVIVTCEHGGNRIPRRFAPLFRGLGGELRSHRGHDIGAAVVATAVARHLGAALFVATTSRLLVDLNRSVDHPRLFSEVTRRLGPEEKRQILVEHYAPYRGAVERTILRETTRGRFVVHLSIHSFTPVLAGVRRRAHVGLLYDPARVSERSLCEPWSAALGRASPGIVARRNYPYRGTSDGLATALRRTYPGSRYAGIEVEINQHLLATRGGALRIARSIADSFRVSEESIRTR